MKGFEQKCFNFGAISIDKMKEPSRQLTKK